MSAEEGPDASLYLAGGLSEKGRRSSNEDAAILAVLSPSSALRAFAVLCDGMGGHNAGEVASRLAIEILKEKIQSFASRSGAPAPPARAEVEAEVRDWVAEVNREIYQRGKSSAEQRGMGTTLALAMVLADGRLVVANVGDSRIYLVSGLNVRQLSVDHTALAEQRRALGSDSVAPEDDAENPFAHALTRSLGQEKLVVPDVRSDVTLLTGDVVILTTDGVTDVLEAERFLTALETTGGLQEAAEEIYRLAFEAGSKDNVSVALLSRGTPARLGPGKAGHAARAEALPSRSGDGMLIAGAASALPQESPTRSGPGRRVALAVAAFGLFLVVLAVGVAARRSAPPHPATAVPSAPATPAPQASAAPAATPPVAAPSPPAQPEVPAIVERNPEADSAAHGPSRPVQPVTGEPSFRAPAVLSGLKPLEFPPTPTDTPTATHTPTPAATDATTPIAPVAPTAAPTPAPASASAATPGVRV